jgi:chemotaxis protein CheX
MKPDLLNCFLGSVSRTFATQLGCVVHPGQLTLERVKPPAISAIIGLSGKTIGTLVLHFSEKLAVKAAGAMLLVQTDGINDDVVDTVAELAALVAAAVRVDLAEFDLTPTVPTVITGRHHRVRFPSNITPLAIPCQTMWGPLGLEIGLAPAAQPVGA